MESLQKRSKLHCIIVVCIYYILCSLKVLHCADNESVALVLDCEGETHTIGKYMVYLHIYIYFSYVLFNFLPHSHYIICLFLKRNHTFKEKGEKYDCIFI